MRMLATVCLALAAQTGLAQGRFQAGAGPLRPDTPLASRQTRRNWSSLPSSRSIWRAPQVVQRNYALPDGPWYGSTPELLVDHRGEGVDAMIDAIEAAVASYPFAGEYRSYPGPNSNTFLAHIGRQRGSAGGVGSQCAGAEFWP